MSIECQGHFFTRYFPGFVYFVIVLYWDKISGERLQDHWSSGYHIWAWRPSWSCDPDAGNKILFPLTKEAPHKIWL